MTTHSRELVEKILEQCIGHEKHIVVSALSVLAYNVCMSMGFGQNDFMGFVRECVLLYQKDGGPDGAIEITWEAE